MIADAELMVLFSKTRDEGAFSELVRRHEPAVIQIARRYFDEHTAADIAQDVFVLLFQKAHLYNPAEEFLPWLLSIAVNRAVDHHRSIRGRTGKRPLTQAMHTRDGANIDVADEPDEAPPDFSAQASLLKTLIPLLPDDQKALVTLIYFEQMPWREASDLIGIPRGSACHLMEKAHKRLRELLAEAESTPEAA